LNVKNAPEELKKKLMANVKYRIGYDSEDSFNHENSNIREKDGLITITYRGSKQLIVHGNMTLFPFHRFYVEFHFEISHLEIELGIN